MTSGDPFSRRFDPAVPQPQLAYVVTTREWDLPKRHIKAMRSFESPWLAACLFFIGAAISFLLGSVGFHTTGNTGSNWFITLVAMGSACLAVAVTCGMGFVWARRVKREDVNTALMLMQSIESIYERSSNPSSPSS
jgi:hypothetical protein